MDTVAAPPPARQRLAAGGRAPRHRHGHAYAALVLAGGYAEAGDNGRRLAQAGDVILHDVFEAHANRFDHRGAVVLNLPLAVLPDTPCAFMRIADPDAVARLAERDTRAARACLFDQLAPAPAQPGDWRDTLARALRESPDLVLGDWATETGLDPATVSRGFRDAFDVSPVRYRAEARARAAWRRLSEGGPLADLAAETGFADQAHMTRAIVALTGLAPGAWRRSNAFKTGSARAA